MYHKLLFLAIPMAAITVAPARVQAQTSCNIKDSSVAEQNEEGANNTRGYEIVTGAVYHFGDLAIRVDNEGPIFQNGGPGFWGFHITVKAPGFYQGYNLIRGNTINLQACNQDVSISMRHSDSLRKDFFVVGVF